MKLKVAFVTRLEECVELVLYNGEVALSYTWISMLLEASNALTKFGLKSINLLQDFYWRP